MALFKIEKGLAANLAANRPNTNEGWCYFTTDDGKFYIDIDTKVNDTSNRIALNANTADKLTSNAGDNNTPVYFSNGVPVACTSLDLDTSGNAATATQVNNSLSINGKTFNGSTAVNVGAIGAAYGGTGKTSLKASANALIASLDAGTASTLNDDVEIITKDTAASGEYYYRRKASVMNQYIQDKADLRYL